MKKISVVLVSLFIFFAVEAGWVYAQQPCSDQAGSEQCPPTTGVSVTFPNPFNCGGASPCNLFTLFRSIIDNIVLPIGGVLAVLAFIYSGFLYVTAQGNETKLKTAHKALLYTSIGPAVLLGSWVIAKVIENTINQLR